MVAALRRRASGASPGVRIYVLDAAEALRHRFSRTAGPGDHSAEMARGADRPEAFGGPGRGARRKVREWLSWGAIRLASCGGVGARAAKPAGHRRGDHGFGSRPTQSGG